MERYRKRKPEKLEKTEKYQKERHICKQKKEP